jgi:hypothetical protein
MAEPYIDMDYNPKRARDYNLDIIYRLNMLIQQAAIKVHNDLPGRDEPDCHPIASISGLRDMLDDLFHLMNLSGIVTGVDWENGGLVADVYDPLDDGHYRIDIPIPPADDDNSGLLTPAKFKDISDLQVGQLALDSRLDAEVTNRINAISGVNNSIDAEKAARIADIIAEVTARNNAISIETTARQQAIYAEAAARANDISVVQANLNNEIAARQQATGTTLEDAKAYTDQQIKDVEENSGTFIRVAFATKADLDAYVIPDRFGEGDFTYVQVDETKENATTRYIIGVEDGQKFWDFGFKLSQNFTNEQMSAINSGLTADKLTEIINAISDSESDIAAEAKARQLAISAEATARENADNELHSADQTLQYNIEAEATARENAISAEVQARATAINDLTTSVNNRVLMSSTANRIYSTNASGGQFLLPYSATVQAASVVMRTANGDVNVPDTPTSDTHATSKKYVDSKVGGGKRFAKIVVGHRDSGYTEKDVDFLCTEENSNYKIIEAFSRLTDGGEIVFLDGLYIIDIILITKKNIVISSSGKAIFSSGRLLLRTDSIVINGLTFSNGCTIDVDGKDCSIRNNKWEGTIADYCIKLKIGNEFVQIVHNDFSKWVAQGASALYLESSPKTLPGGITSMSRLFDVGLDGVAGFNRV